MKKATEVKEATKEKDIIMMKKMNSKKNKFVEQYIEKKFLLIHYFLLFYLDNLIKLYKFLFMI